MARVDVLQHHGAVDPTRFFPNLARHVDAAEAGHSRHVGGVDAESLFVSGQRTVDIAPFFEDSGETLAVLGDVIFAAGIGVPLLRAATVYAVGGPRLLAPAALPLGFLVMMVPPPGFVVSRVMIELKLFVTYVSVELLNASGAVVAAVGNQIHVPGHVLFVADACSGLTSIVTMLPLSVVVAYFFSHGIWRRVAVVLSVIPLAIAANVVRILFTVAMVGDFGIEVTQGWLHESFGLVTFMIGTLALLSVARGLR